MNTYITASFSVQSRLRKWGLPAVFLILGLLSIVLVSGTNAQEEEPLPPATTLVSMSSSGAIADGPSSNVSISGDGRFVAFESRATNLVPDDTNRSTDIFVYDRETLETERISVNSNGEQGNKSSSEPSISDDGRFVAFTSKATNLIPLPESRKVYRGPGINVYVHDRETSETSLVSRTPTGQPADRHAWLPDISPDGGFVSYSSHSAILVVPDRNKIKRDAFVHDLNTSETWYADVLPNGENPWSGGSFAALGANGRFVAFQSLADDLVPNDHNRIFDIFVYDKELGETSIVSVSSTGEHGAYRSWFADITPDGRYVVYETRSVLAAEDANRVTDIYRHDTWTNETVLVSVSSVGEPGNGDSGRPKISADGRYVSFLSTASNLAATDKNGQYDVFVHDMLTGETILASHNPDGDSGHGRTLKPAMSADGRFVVFASAADDLTLNDTNRKADIFVVELQWSAVPPEDVR